MGLFGLACKEPRQVKMVAKKEKKGRSGMKAMKDVVTREYTINMHKRIHGMGFKKRAPRAVKEIKKFALQMMGTSDVKSTLASTRPSGNRELGTFLTDSAFVCRASVTRTRTRPTSCTHSSLTCRSPRSRDSQPSTSIP